MSDTPDFFIDWAALWADDSDDSDWLYEPVLARGRGHAIFAWQKTGKSLLLLWLAAWLATRPGTVVIYLDYEMTEDDLRDRLDDMGYGATSDLARLRYALLPSLPPLDTQAGGEAVIALVDQAQADYPDHHIVVCVDTLSRAVRGEENSADTVRNFYRATGMQLKSKGVTWIRLDHAGKDAGQGQRGSSAKGDDVDVVWRVEKTDTGLTLHREAARMRWVPDKVRLHMTEEPLRFVQVDYAWPAGTKECAEILNKLGVALEVKTRAAQTALKDAGHKMRKQVLCAALRFRRERALEDLRPEDLPGDDVVDGEKSGSSETGNRTYVPPREPAREPNTETAPDLHRNQTGTNGNHPGAGVGTRGGGDVGTTPGTPLDQTCETCPRELLTDQSQTLGICVICRNQKGTPGEAWPDTRRADTSDTTVTTGRLAPCVGCGQPASPGAAIADGRLLHANCEDPLDRS